MNKVCSKTANWIFVLMLMIPGSVLTAEDPPSAQDQAVQEAQPVAAMPVPPALHHALASSLSEAASFGAKTIPTPPTGTWGIVSAGDGGGAIFRDSNSEAEAWLGTDSTGIIAFGLDQGGHFIDSDHSGYAIVAHGDRGIEAYGTEIGGYFEDSDGTGYAYVGYGDWGVEGFGSEGGGHFDDLSSSSWASVANDIYKIVGTGAVSFVQNHPYDPSSVIVYAAPEGDEVATYTRGTAKLVDGEATVPLGETFKWVTNPDLGLTAYLTPIGEWCDLYVVEKATDEITVRSRDGSDCAFDFLVYGLRIGFEESSLVQEKKQESYIPSMTNHRQLYERRPDLKSYNSLERFKGMHHAIDPKAKLDLSRAQALRDAIIEFDPAVHELPMRPGHEEMQVDDLALDEDQREGVQGHERVRAARADRDRRLAPGHSALGSTIPVDNESNVYAPSFRPSSQDLASLVTVSEAVEPGDVLVIDRSSVGMMRRGADSHDTGVIGVVTPGAGIVLGTQRLGASEDGLAVKTPHRAAVALAGVVSCKVDADYGAIWPGDLLVTSPTPGHAMRTDAPLPGTMIGKALEPLEDGVGVIKVLVMLR